MEDITTLRQQLADAQRELRQLQNRQKLLENKRRTILSRQRTHRLCIHGGTLENVFPAVAAMDGAETLAFLRALSGLPGARELAVNAGKEPNGG